MELIIDAPQPKQELFMTDKHRYIAFGGARGGGKSWAVRAKAKLLALNYGGIKILIVRRTFPELEQNHISILKAELLGVAKYNTQNKVLTFCNGSIIKFGYLARDTDLDQYQGTEWDIIFLDEATQLSENQMTALFATNRGVNDFPKRIYFTCNPGGQGHQYIKRLFIDRKFKEFENPDDYFFIQSKVTDNQKLMESNPEYIKYLMQQPTKRRKAWLEGDWDAFSGQFFEEFIDDDTHYIDKRWSHVIAPFEIPAGWTIHRSFDFGYSKPFDCSWWAIDYEGRAYLILQYYGCEPNEANVGIKQPPDRIFSEIHRIETEHRWLKGRHIYGVADPAIWDASHGESIAETAEKHYVFFDKGDNNRLSGWMQCHYRLTFDDEGIPMVYFFNTCHHAIRTLPLLIYSETKVEDLDTDMEDHFADSFRYFCMCRPIKPAERAKQKPRADDPLNLQTDSILNAQTYARYNY